MEVPGASRMSSHLSFPLFESLRPGDGNLMVLTLADAELCSKRVGGIGYNPAAAINQENPDV
jgi:hypothetical protein